MSEYPSRRELRKRAEESAHAAAEDAAQSAPAHTGELASSAEAVTAPKPSTAQTTTTAKTKGEKAATGHTLGKAHYDEFGNYLGHPQFDENGDYVAHAQFSDEGTFIGHVHYEDAYGNPVIPEFESPDEPTKPTKKRRRAAAPIVLLLALALVAAGALWIIKSVVPQFTGPATVTDYPGPGHGSAEIVISPGDSGRTIAATLVDAGVVATSNAFVDAYNANPAASGISPGTYSLKLEMSGEGAVNALLDPASRVELKLVVPEGYTAQQIYERIQSQTGFAVADLQAVAAGGAIGLPAEAGGNPEGWLFPATYTFEPSATAETILSAMVAKTISVLDGLGVAPEDRERVLIIASVAEKEVSHAGPNGEDYHPMVTRVIENRLEQSIPLGMDTIVAYGLNKRALDLTVDDLNAPGPYNSRINLGLPPTPISNPGEVSIQAALNPAEGDWTYFVTVNLLTGETKFTNDYNEFLQFKQEFNTWYEEYVASSPDERVTVKRAAVLGHPIAHSLSPTLHRAAYRHLGLDWTFEAIDVEPEGLPALLAGLDASWAGLALTMPLKTAVVPLLDHIEGLAKVLGVVNTVLVQPTPADRLLVGANTDVVGLAGAIRALMADVPPRRVVVLGAGATARSALVSLASLGCRDPLVVARSRGRAGPLIANAHRMDLRAHVVGWENLAENAAKADLVISTVPSAAQSDAIGWLSPASDSLTARLLDITYDPDPSPLVAWWRERRLAADNGLRMLALQAREQIRLMTGREVPVSVMLDALGLESR